MDVYMESKLFIFFIWTLFLNAPLIRPTTAGRATYDYVAGGVFYFQVENNYSSSNFFLPFLTH